MVKVNPSLGFRVLGFLVSGLELGFRLGKIICLEHAIGAPVSLVFGWIVLGHENLEQCRNNYPHDSIAP